jgi:hypothetical protein
LYQGRGFMVFQHWENHNRFQNEPRELEAKSWKDAHLNEKRQQLFNNENISNNKVLPEMS